MFEAVYFNANRTTMNRAKSPWSAGHFWSWDPMLGRAIVSNVVRSSGSSSSVKMECQFANGICHRLPDRSELPRHGKGKLLRQIHRSRFSLRVPVHWHWDAGPFFDFAVWVRILRHRTGTSTNQEFAISLHRPTPGNRPSGTGTFHK